MSTRTSSTIRSLALPLCLMMAGPGRLAIAEKPPQQVRVKISLYSSVAPGISGEDAWANTRPLLELLGEKLACVFDFDLRNGETAKDLQRFGEEINEGTVHIGVIWGLEYGWLRMDWPELKPMAVCAQVKFAYRSRLMVRQDFRNRTLDDLKNTRLATYTRASLMDRMYLDKLLKDRKQTVKTYFEEVKNYQTPQDAIVAVRDNKADCVVVNMVAYARHIRNQPEVKLDYLLESEPFPEAVLVGRVERINGLRRGLWDEFCRTLCDIHRPPKGRRSPPPRARQCLDFWMIERFRPPDASFEKDVTARLDEYPISALQSLAPGGQR